ncbi:MAG: hypothetical protein IT452_23045 [Planctomycetia bacterium]|nr:hypothetical protein [Planctomycetia bacterium]
MTVRIPLVAVLLAAALAGCGPASVSATKGDKKLTLFQPEAATVKAGESAQVSLRVTRENMTDSVSIRFEALPPGVTVDNSTSIANGVETATCTFKAAADAKSVSGHEVRVIAEAQGGMVAKTVMKVTVQGK